MYTNQQNMLLQVRVDKNLTAVRLRLMEEQDSLVGAHEQVCAGVCASGWLNNPRV